MGIVDRRVSPRVSQDAYDADRITHSYITNVSRPLRSQEARGYQYSPAPSFPNLAFPQDAGSMVRHQILPRPTNDRAAAADDLLSLIQAVKSGRKPQYEQIRRGDWTLSQLTSADNRHTHKHEVSNTFEGQTTPAMSEWYHKGGRTRPEPSTSPKKRKVGRPAKKAVFEGEYSTKKKRGKKPTYIVRKETKALLEMEVEKLKLQVAQLRKASGIPDAFFAEKEQLRLKMHDNDKLRAELRKQDLLLRNAHSVIAVEYLMKCSNCPIETFIHLTTNLDQRRALLEGLKEIKLQQANEFINNRSGFLPQVTQWCQESKFEVSDGNYCAEKMDNTPFYGVRSVRQVFEALQVYFQNTEISLFKMFGDIPRNEDHDSLAKNSFSNHRLVCTLAHGVKADKNIVKFFKFVDAKVEADLERQSSYGLVAIDSVDIDDLYPYIPQERVRIDISAAMKFTEHFRKRPSNRIRKTPKTLHPLYGKGFPYNQDLEDSDDDENERVVVLTRFVRVKLHHTKMDIPSHILQEVRQGLCSFLDSMIQSMHRIIYETQ
ncbi:uncharacterized protein PHALS_12798 [Plasmopara halstedii]|uniref:Uncharacterized protein n=1 Tax=Plasmopara halstedii TaxID=4781 RepID=A0A0N7L5V5_PLAHL|nr:uncharacterized protein PHALS_12798 [Plasmopara halstedii]CEG42531.1 hypothetical protein PHALS_12798 [Plasmopara halstedii]|eukprot:XP_024578900.1 hypothetical protein PHALS_12798 [Plasmopara halstedii]